MRNPFIAYWADVNKLYAYTYREIVDLWTHAWIMYCNFLGRMDSRKSNHVDTSYISEAHDL